MCALPVVCADLAIRTTGNFPRIFQSCALIRSRVRVFAACRLSREQAPPGNGLSKSLRLAHGNRRILRVSAMNPKISPRFPPDFQRSGSLAKHRGRTPKIGSSLATPMIGDSRGILQTSGSDAKDRGRISKASRSMAQSRFDLRGAGGQVSSFSLIPRSAKLAACLNSQAGSLPLSLCVRTSVSYSEASLRCPSDIHFAHTGRNGPDQMFQI